MIHDRDDPARAASASAFVRKNGVDASGPTPAAEICTTRPTDAAPQATLASLATLATSGHVGLAGLEEGFHATREGCEVIAGAVLKGARAIDDSVDAGQDGAPMSRLRQAGDVRLDPRHVRMGTTHARGGPAKSGDRVSGPDEPANDGKADEPITSENEDTHRCTDKR